MGAEFVNPGCRLDLPARTKETSVLARASPVGCGVFGADVGVGWRVWMLVGCLVFGGVVLGCVVQQVVWVTAVGL
jgi:hypothetical protein